MGFAKSAEKRANDLAPKGKAQNKTGTAKLM
jgi:hypothetical protein